MADKPALTDRERIEALEAQVATLSAALAAETTERMAEIAALRAVTNQRRVSASRGR